MRFSISLYLALISNCLYSQGMDQNAVRSYELFYGNLMYQKSFPDLNTTQIIGISLNTSVTNNKYSGSGSPAHIALGFVLPTETEYSDSVSAKLNGYFFNLSLFGYDIFQKSENLDLIFISGFNVGRVRLNNDFFNQRNSLVAPKLTLQCRVKIKKISLALTGEYQFDISDKEWYKLHLGAGQSFTIQSFRQSGFFVGISIGYSRF